MTLDFGFDFDDRDVRRVKMTPNLFLAYVEAIRKKIGHMILWGVLSIIAMAALINNIFQLSWIGQGDFLRWTSFIAALVTVGAFAYASAWDGPKAVKLYTCMATEGFGEFIQKKLEILDKLTDPASRKLLLLRKKDIKQINKTILSAQTLLELHDGMFGEEASVDADLYDEINFLHDYVDLFGFYIKAKTKLD